MGMSDIEIGSVWVSKKNKTALLRVSAVEGLVVETHWLDTLHHCFDWRTSDFLSKYEPVPDMVNHPQHYKDASGVECCQVTDFMMFNAASCFKYLYRCGNKWDDIEDLKKAVWYAKRAYLTGNNKQPNSLQWDQDIRAIASYRKHGIRKAMTAIRTYSWLAVAAFIENEIARLEGAKNLGGSCYVYKAKQPTWVDDE